MVCRSCGTAVKRKCLPGNGCMGKHQAKHFLALTKRVQLMQMHEGAENHHDRGLTDVADVQFASMPAGACDCRGLLHDMGQGQHNSD